jgi:NitT/TauT family transport system substrate-binding protein
MPVRRTFIKALGSAVLASSAPGCGWLTDKPIAIAAHVWVGYESMFLARNEGWLDTKKVSLLETTNATDSLSALTDGRVDGAALTLDEMLKAREIGLSLTAVLVFDVSVGADMLVVRPAIKHLADLKGKRIGLEKSSVAALLLSEILLAAGLVPKDVELIHVDVDKHRHAWRNKQADAFITYEPMASQLLMDGAVKLFDSRKIPDTIVDVLAIRSDRLDPAHAGAVRHLVAAHFQALDHLTRNPHDAAYRMAGRLGVPAREVLSAFKGLLLPDVAHNFRLLAGGQSTLLASARKVSDNMVKGGLLRQQDTLIDLIRADFLPDDGQVR